MEGADIAAWDGLARDLLEDTGFDDGPVDAFALAKVCGFEIWPKRGRQRSTEGEIHLDLRARVERQQSTVAHEIGHWALDRGREGQGEDGAWYVGGALLVPRSQLLTQLRGTWRLDDLRRAHPNASHELLARRISEVRDATVTIYDHARLKKRVSSPWLPSPPPPTSLERALVDAAYATGKPARLGLTQAVPVFEGRWRRVVLVSVPA